MRLLIILAKNKKELNTWRQKIEESTVNLIFFICLFTGDYFFLNSLIRFFILYFKFLLYLRGGWHLLQKNT